MPVVSRQKRGGKIMSGGLMRKHKKCQKSDKYDPDKRICVVCGWAQKVHKNKLFPKEQNEVGE